MRHPLDPDRLKALHMAQAVRRDIQKMKNLIQFREVGEQDDPTSLPSWPGTCPTITSSRAFAQHFVRASVWLWAILTPERCVRCRSGQLDFAPGLEAGRSPASGADVASWFDRYRSVFDAAPATVAQ